MSLSRTNNNVKFYNQISFRIYFYFAVIICVFSAVVGIVFIQMSENNSKRIYQERVENKGKNIADVLNSYIVYENYDEAPAFLLTLNKVEANDMDIWLVSNGQENSPMNNLTDTNLSNVELNASVEVVLDKALQGEMVNRVYYSDIYMDTVISLGVPVFDEKNEVVGAVLVHAPIKGQKELVSTSFKMIILSTIVALIVSIIITLLFAKRISRPIAKLRNAAVALAEGNYSNKIQSKERDELGDLARTFDILSERLAKTEEDRKNMEQMRLDFFANVSHELRTPITVIRAYTEMLIDGIVTDPDKITSNYERMLKECKGMERLVGDLLTLSKMQNPDFVIEKEPINLVQIFDDITRSAAAICLKKNITLDIVKQSDNIIMLGDYDRLRQMFMIIFDNAVKFSHENDIIYINISYMDTIKVVIKDNGIGIPKKDIPYVFDKFYKSKLKQNENGSGLGLAIARQIAIRHGGTIEVVSEEGKGTEFVFKFEYFDNKKTLYKEVATTSEE